MQRSETLTDGLSCDPFLRAAIEVTFRSMRIEFKDTAALDKGTTCESTRALSDKLVSILFIYI